MRVASHLDLVHVAGRSRRSLLLWVPVLCLAVTLSGGVLPASAEESTKAETVSADQRVGMVEGPQGELPRVAALKRPV